MEQQEAFIKSIKENEGILYKVARLYADTNEDRKDLYQEMVYQLWKSFDRFEGKSKWSTWMYRVALNTALSWLNRSRKLKNFDTELSIPERIDEANEDLEEQLGLMYAHIKQLNVLDRGLVFLYLDGKTYEEIAQITGFMVSNVGTRLGRIRLKLKTEIKKGAYGMG